VNPRLNIKKDTKIYVACPANVATGGPELLHQFAFKLKKNNLNVFIFYTNRTGKDPVHNNYREYAIEWVEEIKDDVHNILIVPEVETNFILNYNKIQKVIWWLSIDFYFLSLPGIVGKLNRILLHKFNIQTYFGFNKRLKNIDLHMVQSKYAETFLKSKKIDNLIYMSDYLHKNFIDIETKLALKENIVAYNPKKGIKFTTELMQAASDIRFVAIENMRREEVVQLLQKAKVYVDFGFHPGKDRIPREAAILKCCVITNKKGSANFFEDLPINNEYKFYDKTSSINGIKKTIQECFFKYDEKINHFKQYVDEIQNQEKQFDNEIKEFIKLSY